MHPSSLASAKQIFSLISHFEHRGGKKIFKPAALFSRITSSV